MQLGENGGSFEERGFLSSAERHIFENSETLLGSEFGEGGAGVYSGLAPGFDFGATLRKIPKSRGIDEGCEWISCGVVDDIAVNLGEKVGRQKITGGGSLAVDVVADFRNVVGR